MQTVHIVRHKVPVEGDSVQQVPRDLGLSRTTVYKYLQGPALGRVETTPRRHPVLDVASSRIDTTVTE
jgi:hypothetical protein